jgi:uncharacterized protein YjbI with pentapeptide repeats
MKETLKTIVSNRQGSLQIHEQDFLNEIIVNKKLYDSTLTKLRLSNCTFEKLDFRRSCFWECEFDSCIFNNSIFFKAEFENCKFKNCRIIDCNLNCISFEETVLDGAVIIDSKLCNSDKSINLKGDFSLFKILIYLE